MEAIKEYQEAIKRDPTNSAYRNNLAAALQKVGDFPAAKVACEKALELDPTYVKAWAKKGDIEFFMKEYHKALETYKKGLEIEPNNSLCVQVRPWPTHRPHRRLVMPEKLTPLPFLYGVVCRRRACKRQQRASTRPRRRRWTWSVRHTAWRIPKSR